jgi:hypothetical protein
MTEQPKTKLLRIICGQMEVGKTTVFSFSQLAEQINLDKDQVDGLLDELEKERFITQFVIQGSDNFKLIAHEKAYTALGDGFMEE